MGNAKDVIQWLARWTMDWKVWVPASARVTVFCWVAYLWHWIGNFPKGTRISKSLTAMIHKSRSTCLAQRDYHANYNIPARSLKFATLLLRVSTSVFSWRPCYDFRSPRLWEKSSFACENMRSKDVQNIITEWPSVLPEDTLILTGNSHSTLFLR